MLAMVGGFVLAASISGITPTVGNQNAGAVTSAPGNTIYSGSPNIVLVQATAGACTSGTGTPVAFSGTPLVADVFIAGTAACSTTANDWFEKVTWTSVVIAASGTTSTCTSQTTCDTFYVATTGGTASNVPFIVEYNNAGVATTGTLNVYLDCGTSSGGALATAYTDISISVTGS
ncbi:MAG: hypothetical protein KGI98_16225 [Euryarchaeota archaeon]|nr:hypothetical protein [Euryarchaeota archaeon]